MCFGGPSAESMYQEKKKSFGPLPSLLLSQAKSGKKSSETGERYLPEGMAEPGFYRPVERGLELRIADKLRELKKRNDQKN